MLIPLPSWIEAEHWKGKWQRKCRGIKEWKMNNVMGGGAEFEYLLAKKPGIV